SNMKQIQIYGADVSVAFVRAGLTGSAITAGWGVCPFVVRTLINPEDAARLRYILHGQLPPHVLTPQEISNGFAQTAVALFLLLVFQLVCTMLFYRRAHDEAHGASVATPTLWPLAAILPGVIGNAIWFYATGAWDSTGFLIGLVPVAVTVGAERVVEK